MAETAAEQLTGKPLLQKIKISNLSKRELAKECGYYSVSKDGEVLEQYLWLPARHHKNLLY